ncbi:hypothetical protein, partial [Klebsiella pneumoniae]|uniref:hypothetical protein n=1 Tax=Klebsiella pneumoniae TaxID=573 RepID=UPI0039F046AD
VTLKMPAFEWVHVQLHQQKGMISLSPPTICNSALFHWPAVIDRIFDVICKALHRYGGSRICTSCEDAELCYKLDWTEDERFSVG